MLKFISAFLRKGSLKSYAMVEVEPVLKKTGALIYAAGYNGPELTKAQVLWWEQQFPSHMRLFYYVKPADRDLGDRAPVRYIFFYTNPAALWYEWKKFLKTQTANQDELADINEDANTFLSACLTHRYRLQLED